MNKKKVLKITPVLVTLNILVLFGIAGFYTYRLVKYYNLQNSSDEDGVSLLANEVIKKRSFLDETKGLVFDEKENTYTYKGEVEDNYLSYSGMTYRILGIDSDGNVKAINEENVTLLYPGFENGYKTSFVNKWLNISDTKDSGVYEKVIAASDMMLTNTYFCNDEVKDTDNITCENNTKDYKITLLSLNDYRAAGGKASFLNNGKSFNLGTLNEEKLSYYVTEDGDIAVQQSQNKAILIRPVITLKATTELKSGDGSKDKPYIIENHNIVELKDSYVGSYISLNKEAYRVVKKLDDKVLVVKADVLMNGENKVEIAFGGEDNIYTLSDGVGKYLNTTYLNSLDLKDSLVEGEFNIGLINLNNYDYSLLKEKTLKAKVGMLTMGDMFVNDASKVLTIFRGIEAEDIVYTINESGYFFGDVLTSKYNIKPAVYLKSNLLVSGGKGTQKSPFELTVPENKTEKSEG